MAMCASDAVFAILTENVLNEQSTRDWVFFEIGLAKGMWAKRENLQPTAYHQYKIFGWKDDKIKLSNDCPVNFITDYDYRSLEPKNKMLNEMKSITKGLSLLL